jgi:hypothetical protein
MWWKTTGHRELYRLLMLWWDPIDVKDIPEAQGEYTGYSGTIGRMLREEATNTELTAFLAESEQHMGLRPNQELNALVTEKLVDWYTESMHTD